MVKVISKNKLERITRWDAPQVDQRQESADASTTAPPRAEVSTASRLHNQRQQAYRHGFEQGRAEGAAAGCAEMERKIQRLGQILNALAQPLEAVDEQVEEELLRLVVIMVQQVIRRELKLDPGEVIGVVRESLSLLPVSAREVRVQLHPEDATLVRESLAVTGGEQASWQIVEDPVISRGGCRVISEASRLDATVEARLQAMAASLLGGERESDEPAS